MHCSSFSGTLSSVAKSTKRATSFRLTADTRNALFRLSKRLNMSRTAIVEMSIRCLNNLDKPLTFEQGLRSALNKIERGRG